MKFKSVNYPEYEQEIIFVEHDGKVLLVLPDGREIATLHMETMEKDVKIDDKWKVAPTKNFWIGFRPNKKMYDGFQEHAAVFIE